MADEKFVVKDSGARQEFQSGARRDIQAGKGRFDLIPSLPVRRLAQIYEAGAVKYGDNNWQKGIPLRRFLDSAERHFNNLKAGEPAEDHAMQAAWNLFSYVWTLNEIEHGRLPAELDDRMAPEPQYALSAKKPLALGEVRSAQVSAEAPVVKTPVAEGLRFGSGLRVQESARNARFQVGSSMFDVERGDMLEVIDWLVRKARQEGLDTTSVAVAATIKETK